MATDPAQEPSRRNFLLYGVGTLATVLGLGAVGIELVRVGVLPGQQELHQLDGECSVAAPQLDFSALGPSYSSTFYSQARHRSVGYTIAYPPGHDRGSALPLIVMLHGYGGNHLDALSGMTPAQAVALNPGGNPLPPMAMVTVDGGGGYWNPHPGDNPMAMVIDELLPRCQKLGLGRAPQRIGTMGISMGGFGALLLAEKYPALISAVAAISPAVWTTFEQAHGANAGAFASAQAFQANDVVTHAGALRRVPVRVASGLADPFHPGVKALADALPGGAEVSFSNGCHTGPFFVAQEPPSLSFLGAHLT
jgi:pimeloyl-ACP methyl ester carboxylesterase